MKELLIRVYQKGVETVQYGQVKVSINTNPNIDPTIRQGIFLLEVKRAHEQNTLRIGCRKSHVYDGVATRPDLAWAIGTTSRYMSNPGKKHWKL